MSDPQEDPLADLFPGTEDAPLPEYEYWGAGDHAAKGRLMPPTPKQEDR